MYPRKFYPEAIFLALACTSFFIYWESQMPHISEDIEEFLYHVIGFAPLLIFSIIYVFISKRADKSNDGILWFLFALVLPSLSLIVIGLIGSSKDKIQEDKSFNESSDLDSKKTELYQLKNQGVLSNEQYERNLKIINEEQIEIKLKNSVEYKSLCKALKSNFISQSEFDSKLKEITNRFN